MMEYKFIKVYEMDIIDIVATINARDYNSAIVEYLKKHDYNDYDILQINGEWI